MTNKNKKIAVVSPNIEAFSGVTQTALSCIEALNEKGVIPDVYSAFGNQKKVNKKFGRKLKYNFKKLLAPKRFALYSGILKNLQFLFKNYDYIYDFTNSFPLNKNSGNYFVYVHFPEFILWKRGKYVGGLLKIYNIPNKSINKIKIKFLDYGQLDVACNSGFTKKNLNQCLNIKTNIIYPPVQIKEFENKNTKRSGVISTASFSIEKNQLMQVEIAESFPKIKFNICGKAERMPSYFKRVKRKAGKVKNVQLLNDLSFEKLKKKLSQSLIFIHTSKNEPFGISTVEAISAGCIPLVHNSGGQKEVVPFKELRFDNEKEAVKKLKKILNLSWGRQERYRKKLQKYIQIFSEKIYKEKLMNYIR